MVGSPEINKVIRKILSPTLKKNRFDKVNTRHNWGWKDQCIWVLNITAVGKHFSDVTGWPPMSVLVELGIYYIFVPTDEQDIKVGPKGELLPRPYHCQLRYDLNSSLDQSEYTRNLDNTADRDRNDIWWIQPDGSNTDAVINDIKQNFLNNGLAWLMKYTDLKEAFIKIEDERDSYNKFYKAKYFAEHLNEIGKYLEYSHLLEHERRRLEG